MIELRLTKKEAIMIITGLKLAEICNENGINIVDEIIKDHLIEDINKKLTIEILEETEEQKEDNLPF